jgi:hypothetical protein
MSDYERFLPKKVEPTDSETLAKVIAYNNAKTASAFAIRSLLARVSRAAAGRY